jgi:cytochrome d ubiquinol oxidase subunit I
MKTSDAVSPIVTSQVATTLVAFILVYGLLGIVGYWLMFINARKGPQEAIT